MSLLIFSCGSRVSQGIIKHFHKTGNFEKIICADVFPNYNHYERYFKFKDTLNPDSKTQIQESKIFNKTQLLDAFKASSHVIYITHDHFKLTPSKLNLISTTAELTFQYSNIEKTVFVTPSEYDHMGEENPIATAITSEKAAMELAGDKSLLIRSDLTFGKHSQLIHNTLFPKIANGSSISFAESQAKRSPIATTDLAKMVEAALGNGETGKSYYAKGKQEYTMREVMSVLEKCSGKSAQLNQDILQNIIKPSAGGLFSEMLWSDCLQNCSKVLASTHNNQPAEYNDAAELLGEGKMEDFEMNYQQSYFEEMRAAGMGPKPKGWIEKILY